MRFAASRRVVLQVSNYFAQLYFTRIYRWVEDIMRVSYVPIIIESFIDVCNMPVESFQKGVKMHLDDSIDLG